jgi:hypothetical protein
MLTIWAPARQSCGIDVYREMYRFPNDIDLICRGNQVVHDVSIDGLY